MSYSIVVLHISSYYIIGEGYMYAEPIEYRVNELLARRSELLKLIVYGWTDKSIALYLGSDTRTVRRVKSILMN